ncbi:mechanosensitive ion channel family protein [Sphingobium sp. RAC03]|uniref:mechanosensitive ion channel family protein n=1 Tax=Sphingobium sp. RAC03 TaxID=1843368 RepID=UPI00083D91A3|nr:mechanosensitive ion channel domain-containing protein [Sphingobium sp. RAC03]AOF95439.1 mechanosensitive ion channel family protein [Sphingobium sp. RAC03]
MDLSLTHITSTAAVSIALAVASAFLIHWALYAIALRLVQQRMDPVLLPALFQPTRWLVVLLALGAGVQPLELGPRVEGLWSIGSKMVFALLVGWLLFRLMRATRVMIERSVDINAEDNLKARQRHTRVRILYRVAQSVIAVLVIAMILMAIPGVRTIGVTLAASAGLVGLAVGAAAQPALKNLIAGIQMAFSEPIRLDDVVIVEGEWGRIEDITLTFVVVRIWDDRRMVVPVSYFLEKPFQNWTTKTSDLLGTVFLYVDPTADVARIREKLVEVTTANARWDKRVVLLQVTDHRADALELRCLLSARNAGVAFDLRCDVREAMLDFLRTEMPEALVRGRQRIEAAEGAAMVPFTRPSDAAG